MTTQERTTAYQILTRADKVQRFSHCPEHGKRSSFFMGVQASLLDDGPNLWMFRCTYIKHTFLSYADPKAPKIGQEEAWVAKQKAARLKDMRG